MPLRDVDLRPVGRSGSAANRDLGDGGGVAPLMNDYKWDFFFVRFLETNLGGMRIRRFPYKLIVAQAVLFCIPLGVYIACTLIASGISQGAPHFGWYLATAGFTVVWAVLLFLPRVFVSTNNPFPELEALDDDDEVEVDDLFSMEAYDHIFAERKALQVLCASLLVRVFLCRWCFYCLGQLLLQGPMPICSCDSHSVYCHWRQDGLPWNGLEPAFFCLALPPGNKVSNRLSSSVSSHACFICKVLPVRKLHT